MKLAHLSDLHFGRYVSGEKLDSLGRDLVSQGAELLVITGDITDRGRISEYRWALDFLKSVAIPYIVVPGNREVSFAAIWEWIVPSLSMKRHRSFFGKSDRIFFRSASDDIIFMGLNTVHTFPPWPGSVSRETRYWLKEKAAEYADRVKVLFVHHPVLPVIRASSFWAHALSDAGEILNICSQTGVWIILQGHKHRSAVMEISFPQRSASVVVSSCGAPLTPRGDAAYHILDISSETVVIRPREFKTGGFSANGSYHFRTNRS
ncbi:MAG TPA: metallophosphoesterase [Desulfomonilaceae bacterium]|nr:metallophosphoesterase [Desulfomonilaceae bacterium]